MLLLSRSLELAQALAFSRGSHTFGNSQPLESEGPVSVHQRQPWLEFVVGTITLRVVVGEGAIGCVKNYEYESTLAQSKISACEFCVALVVEVQYCQVC